MYPWVTNEVQLSGADWSSILGLPACQMLAFHEVVRHDQLTSQNVLFWFLLYVIHCTFFSPFDMSSSIYTLLLRSLCH